jgi:hypothetical protein
MRYWQPLRALARDAAASNVATEAVIRGLFGYPAQCDTKAA